MPTETLGRPAMPAINEQIHTDRHLPLHPHPLPCRVLRLVCNPSSERGALWSAGLTPQLIDPTGDSLRPGFGLVRARREEREFAPKTKTCYQFGTRLAFCLTRRAGDKPMLTYNERIISVAAPLRTGFIKQPFQPWWHASQCTAAKY